MQKPDSADLKPFLYLALGLVVWWLLPAAIRRFVREGFYEFQAPVIVSESHLTDLQSYWEKRALRSKDALVSQNAEQARIIAGLSTDVRRLRQLGNENHRLREILTMQEPLEYRTLVARVVRRDINTWWKRLLLRRGTTDGVRVGAPVITGSSVVGRVVRVHHSTCEVQLISDPDFRASVNVEGNNDHAAIYQGLAARPFDPPRGIITHLWAGYQYTPASGAPVSVYTSGSGGIFPPGLLLGEITGEITMTTDGLFHTGDVQLHRQLHMLEEATILIPMAERDTVEEILGK